MRIVGFAVVAALTGLVSAGPISSASADVLINVDKSQQRMTVLVNGTVLTEGDPQQIAQDPRVKAVYLGHGDEHV